MISFFPNFQLMTEKTKKYSNEMILTRLKRLLTEYYSDTYFKCTFKTQEPIF